MRYCFTFGLSLLLFIGSLSAKDRHVLLLAGQSNMKKLAPKVDLITKEMGRILSSRDTFEHVVSSEGGQPIKQWTKNWDEFCSKNGIRAVPKAYKRKPHEEGAGELYQKLIDGAKPLLAKKPSSVTFVWLQGETDAWYDDWAPHYEKLLTYLIANLRKDLDCPEMNIVICRISDCKNNGKWEAIRTAQMNVVAKEPRASWADSDDLNGEKNDIHYPKEGYIELALRVARQASALIKGETPAKDGRPSK